MTASTADDLIGKRETQHLEFKSSQSLRKPATIAREVVALLNAEGGEVWIGVQEIDGVASAVEIIPRVAAECIDLRNHLIDTVEPSPTNAEANVEVIGTTLRVRVGRATRKPYALRKDRGRQYILRVGDRVREMTREEIAEAFRTPDSDEKSLEVIEYAVKKVQEGIDEERKARRARLWWRLVVAPPLNVEFSNSDKPFFNAILTDPRQSGNRPNGWTMTLFHDRWPRLGPREIEHVFGEGDFEHRVTIGSDGTITFAAPLLRLNRVPWETDMSEIFSFALLELPVSAFRIASKVLDRLGAGDSDRKIICGAVLSGIRGMTMRPGSPNEPSLPWKHPGKVGPDQTDLAIDPFTLGANELISRPDAAAYQLVRRFYYEFGLEEEDIPREFDRQSHILRFST